MYHFELERFYTSKLNLSLVPISLRPNTLHKALKASYQTWKEEIKPSLAFDLFSKASSSKKTLLGDFFEKILSLCVSSCQSVKVVPEPGNSFVEVVLSQQPQMINILENYYSWIAKSDSLQKYATTNVFKINIG